MSTDSDDLPYQDTKPVGAADFYFAINATFAHIRDRMGDEGLAEYWRGLGADYQRPVWERWVTGGLPAVAAYQRAFFAAEPGAEVTVTEEPEQVVLDVAVCPAIRHLRAHDRTIVDTFCRHCFVMGDAAAEQAGLEVRVAGGAGSCRQVFTPRGTAPAQDLDDIRRCDPSDHGEVQG